MPSLLVIAANTISSDKCKNATVAWACNVGISGSSGFAAYLVAIWVCNVDNATEFVKKNKWVW